MYSLYTVYFLYLQQRSMYFETGCIQKTFLIFTSVLFKRGRWQYEPFKPFITNFSGHAFFLILSVNGHTYFM